MNFFCLGKLVWLLVNVLNQQTKLAGSAAQFFGALSFSSSEEAARGARC